MKTPRNYQKLAIDWMQNHNTYLCDDCGLGKTLTSIEAAKGRIRNLVVCRKSARLQWQQEIQEQLGADTFITNYTPYKFREMEGWFISYYEELTPKGILYPVAQTVWHTIIFDEAHAIKNYHTARSKNLRNLSAGRKFGLSATPIEKHGGELWPVLRWLDPDHFPSYWQWVEQHFEVTPGYFGGFDIGDLIDPVTYQAEVSPYVIRRMKADVAPELPPLIEIEVPIDMNQDQMEAYFLMLAQRDVLVKIQDKEILIENALALFTRLHQLSVLPVMLGLDILSPKMAWLRDFVEDHPDMRIVVFSRYRGVVEYVRDILSNYGVYIVMSGIDESERFKRGDGRILAGTLDSLSESLSLEMADAEIFLDAHWSSRVMKQAKDRIHRMNITEPKLAYYLMASDVDGRVMDCVKGKYDDQEMLLRFVHENNEAIERRD